MAFPTLYPDEKNDNVKRHSSIDQFDGFLSVYKKGGWAPLLFDQLDGITCETIKTHPVIISFTNDIGYTFPEAHCTLSSDKFIYVDKEGVEQKPLSHCFGGEGEFYDTFIKKYSFVNFSDNTSLGVHNTTTLRTGLSYVLADENLPPEE